MACFAHQHSLHGDTEPMPFAEPGVRPHYAPDRAVRIVHATIRLSLEPVARTFTGLARLRLEAFPGYRGEIELDLDDVTVASVVDDKGAALPYEHADGRLVIVAEPLPEEIVVRWRGSDPQRGLYFVGPTAAEPNRPHTAWTQCQDEDAHFVFPCQDHPSVKHPWTLALDAPSGYTLLSNGKHGDTGERDGRVYSRFEQEEPMAAYLVTFVAAPLVAIEATAKGGGAAEVPLRYLVPPGTEGDVDRAFGRTPAMIAHFAERIGVPYPWPRYDQVVVHDFVFGGMENVACTTMTDLLLVDEKAALEWEADGLVSHELAHQWFGDLVTCQDWSQGWLNESWATYMEAVWWEHSRPADEATWYRFQTAAAYHAEASGRYRRPIVSYDFREPIDVFDRHLYNKGSCVLWTLRHQLGDEAFWGGVRHYLERHAHTTVHTRHFQRALEEASGANLDGFFAQWVHAPGHPQIEVRLGKSAGPSNGAASDELVTVTVKQTQAAEGVPQVFTFPLRLVLVGEDGRERTVDLRVDERERTWAVPTDGRIATVKVDPGYRVLAEIKLKGPEPWLERLLKDADPVLALRSAKALLAEGSRRGFEAVTQALREHPFHGVRGALAGDLGKIGTAGARDVLLAALATEQDPRARRAIVAALGSFRETVVADALLKLLGETLPTWQLEGQALLSLGQTRDPRARAALEGRLQRPSWAEILRSRALEGLAETEDPDVLEVLVAHTRADQSDRTRSAASIALGRLSDAVEEVRRPAVERLLEVLVEPGFRTQLAAISALARVGDPKSEPALDRLHRSAPDGRTRRSAYEALTRIRRGRTTEQGLAGLRRRLDEVSEENSRLRERVDKLER